jgi:hypothetical protein
MTTYYKIDNLPEGYDRNDQYLRLERIWWEGKQNLMNAYEFLDGCLTDDGDFFFSRTICRDDDFFTSLNIRLPHGVQARLEQTIADLAVIATAFLNTQIHLGFSEEPK